MNLQIKHFFMLTLFGFPEILSGLTEREGQQRNSCMVVALKGAVNTGSCNFKLYVCNGELNDKKSIAKCKKVKKPSSIRNYSITGKGLIFTFTLTIPKKGKITFSASEVKTEKTTTTTTTTTTTSTTSMPKQDNCSPGLTKVCIENPEDSSSKMTQVCPRTVSNRTTSTKEEQICSCLSVLTVAQAVSDGINPLGHSQNGCVYLEYDLVFPGVNANLAMMNMTEMKILWNIDSLINSFSTTRVSRQSLENIISDAMLSAARHELLLQSRGHASQFIRSSLYSKQIAHNAYMDQAIRGVVDVDMQEEVQETCRNLTENLLNSPECENCNPADTYRTISGCCNNLNNNNYGRAHQPLIRFMANAYSDSESLPRGGLNPSTLPNPRKISSVVHRVKEPAKDPVVSVMLMQFGQFLDHDIDLTPEQELNCCDPSVLVEDLKKKETERFCFNIDVIDDPFFNLTCLPFTRSDAICTHGLEREQLNALTSFIDGSNIYGSDSETATKLRELSGGALKTHVLGPLLPTRKQAGFESDEERHPQDLVAGDVRALEQPGLTAMHSVFLLEHNRLANLLQKFGLDLSDQEIYDIARRVVGAELQNIVYNEFLPLVLGDYWMQRFGLYLPDNFEDSTDYNSVENPTIRNEFATVGFRFAHSLIPSQLVPTINPVRISQLSCPLNQNFFQFDQFSIGSDKSAKAWMNVLLGLQYQQSPAMDTAMSNNVIDFLFCGENCLLPGGFGQDLAARNIQRGRDHGLPSYSMFRRFCNRSAPINWDNKPFNINSDVWERLQSVYTEVDDIDPFTGGLAENAVNGGLVGDTFACIIGLQFSALKEGDRFFFTHPSDGSNSERGLLAPVKVAIRKRRLGDVICDNTETESSPALVMRRDQENETCSDKPSLGYQDIKPIVPTRTRTGLFVGPGGFTSTVEVLELPTLRSICNPPEFPGNTFGNVLVKQDLGFTVCGGSFTANCHVLTPQGWIESQPMNTVREGARSVQLGDNWWVSGGRVSSASGSHVASSELLFPNGSWINYVDLPTVLHRHCMVSLNTTHIFMMGGNPNLFWSTRISNAYIFDSVEEQWTQVESMKTARSEHSCALLPDGRVIVTGGSGTDGKLLKSTEFFSLSSLTWTDGPDLLQPMSFSSLETIGSETFLLGGSLSSLFSSNSDVIYRLNQDRSSWIEAGRLNTRKRFFDVLPMNFDDCYGFTV